MCSSIISLLYKLLKLYLQAENVDALTFVFRFVYKDSSNDGHGLVSNKKISRIKRRFLMSSSMGQVVAFITSQFDYKVNFQLIRIYPLLEITSEMHNRSLLELDMKNNTAFCVNII